MSKDTHELVCGLLDTLDPPSSFLRGPWAFPSP